MNKGMPTPRAVVIPFGVPDDGRGLGLGLAALVHSFAQIDGESVALAQLLARARKPPAEADDDDEEREPEDARPAPAEASPVEAFVPPQAWKDLTGNGAAPPEVSFVVTGAFEPPTDGRGLIQLLVFGAKDGRTHAKVEAHVDGENAGQALIAALEEAWSQLPGELGQLGTVREIGDIMLVALQIVLRADRCAHQHTCLL
jgi:hypothetical protein